ncbi:MAG: outer membrane homotrimeric porin [Desulfovibrionaceae bacterium]|jgi:hypothetical protein|nr:outer membrane homotrimeric porin [Desulfovibrionaceae bacterium]
MKKFLTLAIVAAFVLSMAATASAVELKAKGELHFSFNWSDNLDFNDADNNAGEGDGQSEDDFFAEQRTRLYLDAIASENLKATFGFEIDSRWGEDNAKTASPGGGELGADAVNIETKRAMLAWTVPNTGLAVTMGIQGLALPGAVGGSPILNDDVAGITASYKFNDMVAATAFWARLYDNNIGANDADGAESADDEFDAWGLLLPVTLDGVSFTPYYVGAQAGVDTTLGNARNFGASAADGDPTEVWWLGTDLKVTLFDPFVFLADFQMGSATCDVEANEAKGWRMDAALQYKMDFMTPMILFNYGSGADDDATDGTEAMPWINTSSNWGVTNTGTDGSASGTGTTLDQALGNAGNSGTGVMAIGAALLDIKFIDNLSNTIKVVYYKGTTDKDLAGAAFTEEDNAWEINLDTKYQIMDNLSTLIEFAWITVDADKDVAGRAGNDPYPDDALRLGVYLDYKF